MRRSFIAQPKLGWAEICIISVVFLAYLPVAFSGERSVLNWFHTDDAFYYFKTAQNISEGRGVTFDGTALTNGFQPLWMVLLVPIFSLARIDLLLPLRLVIGLQVLIAAGTSLLLYRLMCRSLSGSVALVAGIGFAFLPGVSDTILKGGTEAGLNALLIVLLLYCTSIEATKHTPRATRLGLVAALAFFARLDNVFLAGVIGIWLIVAHWLQRTTPRELDWRRDIRLAMGYSLPLLLLGGAYVGVNQALFGYPTPVSAQIKAWWGTLDLTVYGFPIHRPIDFVGQLMTNDPSLGPWSIMTSPMYALAESLIARLGLPISLSLRRFFLLAEFLLLAALVAGLIRKGRKGAAPTFLTLPIPPLFLACLMQISYYKLSGHLAQKPWYWIGEALVILLLGALAADSAWRLLRPRRWGAVLCYAALLGVLWWWVIPQIRHLPTLFESGENANEHYYLERAEWLQEQTEPGAKIGMTGSGSAGYFTSGRTIVNLDGLISGVEYLQALRGGNGAQYLRRIGLDYVFGNGYILLETQPYRQIFGGRLTLVREWRGTDRDLYLWRFTP
jgi:hypothetical protein